MKITKSRIKGKEYLYAYDHVFIAKGKRIRKNKSLGAADSLNDVVVKKRLKSFQEDLLIEEKKRRAQYWQNRIQDTQFYKYTTIQKIEQIRTELYRVKEQMGPFANSAMETAFLVDFIYNSNAIEGSKLPRDKVAQLVTSGSKKNDEVGNMAKAIYYMNHGFTMHISSIKAVQAIALAHEPYNVGFRKKRVVVGDNFSEEEVTDWKEIKTQLQELMYWFHDANKTWYPPELACTFYYRFERIHPFADGNGRIGRLMMNQILKDHRYHPMIIWNSRRKAHMNAFTSYGRGKRAVYHAFMIDQFVKTHEIYLQKIHNAFQFEQLSDFFLKPSEHRSAQ